MGNINKKVEAVRTSLVKKLPLSNPLEGHPISDKEEYVKKLYIDFLCIIAQYENEDSENQTKFIQRIMTGAGLTEPISEHIKNAMEVTEERCDEFLKQCKENKLIDIFIVDSLLIACADGEPNRKQVEFISELACALQVKKNRMKWLAGLVRAIFEQDTDGYHKVSQEMPHDERTEILGDLVCYIKDFVCGILIDTDDLLWIYSKEKQELDIRALFPNLELSRKHVVIENVIVDLEDEEDDFDDEVLADDEGKVLCIKSCETIKLIHSEFTGIKLKITAAKKIEVVSCLFKEATDGAMDIEGSDEVAFRKCKFVHCGRRGSYRYNNRLICGGALQINNEDSSLRAIVSIESCEFVECFSIGYEFNGATAPVLGGNLKKFTVKDTQFRNNVIEYSRNATKVLISLSNSFYDSLECEVGTIEIIGESIPLVEDRYLKKPVL